MQALHTLLYEYIPAAFLLGVLMIECNWSITRMIGNKGEAPTLVHYKLVILMHLTYGRENTVEYVQSLCVAHLLWTDRYTVPAACQSEEMCEEALFSKFSAALQKHPNAKTLDDAFDLVLTMPPPSTAKKDISSSKVSHALLMGIGGRLQQLVRHKAFACGSCALRPMDQCKLLYTAAAYPLHYPPRLRKKIVEEY